MFFSAPHVSVSNRFCSRLFLIRFLSAGLTAMAGLIVPPMWGRLSDRHLQTPPPLFSFWWPRPPETPQWKTTATNNPSHNPPGLTPIYPELFITFVGLNLWSCTRETGSVFWDVCVGPRQGGSPPQEVKGQRSKVGGGANWRVRGSAATMRIRTLSLTSEVCETQQVSDQFEPLWDRKGAWPTRAPDHSYDIRGERDNLIG